MAEILLLYITYEGLKRMHPHARHLQESKLYITYEGLKQAKFARFNVPFFFVVHYL